MKIDGWPIGELLHPTDFSASSAVAFYHALRIAIANGSRFEILHVEPKAREEQHWSQFPQVRKTLEKWNFLEEGSHQRDVVRKLGVDVHKTEIRSGKPLAAIRKHLEEGSPDLIALATEGRDGVARWLRPSLSEKLARHSITPTLFVAAGTRGFVSMESGEVEIKRVLIPTDHRPDPQIAIEAARDFVRGLGVGSFVLETLFVGDDTKAPTIALADEQDFTFENTIVQGDPVDQITKAASERGADLIVMSTAGHEGFLDALRGSTTEQVLRQATCPVLAIPDRV